MKLTTITILVTIALLLCFISPAIAFFDDYSDPYDTSRVGENASQEEINNAQSKVANVIDLLNGGEFNDTDWYLTFNDGRKQVGTWSSSYTAKKGADVCSLVITTNSSYRLTRKYRESITSPVSYKSSYTYKINMAFLDYVSGRCKTGFCEMRFRGFETGRQFYGTDPDLDFIKSSGYSKEKNYSTGKVITEQKEEGGAYSTTVYTQQENIAKLFERLAEEAMNSCSKLRPPQK